MPRPLASIEPTDAQQALIDDVAARYFAGETLVQIAAAIGYSYQRVSQLLQLFRAQLREKNINRFQEFIDLELLKIDKREAAAWQAWGRSKRPLRRIHKEFDAGFPANKKKPAKVLTDKQTRDGDPRFLELAHKCAELRCKLLGLFPVESEHGSNKPSDFKTREQMAEHINTLAKQIEHRITTLPGPKPV